MGDSQTNSKFTSKARFQHQLQIRLLGSFYLLKQMFLSNLVLKSLNKKVNFNLDTAIMISGFNRPIPFVKRLTLPQHSNGGRAVDYVRPISLSDLGRLVSKYTPWHLSEVFVTTSLTSVLRLSINSSVKS